MFCSNYIRFIIVISHYLYLCTQNGFNNKKNEGKLKKVIVLLSFSVR